MSAVNVIGSDLSKLVFSIHGVDELGKTKLLKIIEPNKVLTEITQFSFYIIGTARDPCVGAPKGAY